MQERRQNVRVHVTPDYDIGIHFGDGLVKVKLQVTDAAVGGVALVIVSQTAEFAAGNEIPLGVTLPDFDRFETKGTIRYTQGTIGGRMGVHLNNLSEEQQSALSRTVSELLERGHSA